MKMRILPLPSFAILVWWLSSLSNIAVVQAEVLNLQQSDFYSTIGRGQPSKWFVKFYAEWCGHCKRLRPIWDELSAKVDDSVGVAKVDATKNRDLADKFGVRGYPTLIYISDDEKTYIRYTGGRALEDLLAFANEGYKEAQTEPLPPPPGWEDILKSYQKRLNKEYLMLEEDFQHILAVRKNAMIAFILIGGALGGLIGCAFGACCCRAGVPKKEKTA